MMKVKILRSLFYGGVPYSAGDVVSIDPDIATELIMSGDAYLVKEIGEDASMSKSTHEVASVKTGKRKKP